jgi:hypothetical protein
LLFGRQRLVSPLPWGNALRSWDGGMVRVARGDWSTDVFWTRPVAIERGELNSPDEDRAFYGAYAARSSGDTAIEAYVLGFERDMQVSFNGTSGEETRRTYGSRVVLLRSRPWSVELEAAFQEGNIGSERIGAWMATVEGRWKPAASRWDPEVRLLFDAASGDESSGGRVQTFNQLFPLGHAHLGHADVIGRQNVLAPSLAEDLTFGYGQLEFRF